MILLALLFAANDTVLEAVTVEHGEGVALSAVKTARLHFGNDRQRDVQIDPAHYPGAKDAAQAKDARASFMIDFDEQPVRDLVKQLGERPTPQALTDFVFRYIEKKNRFRLLDAASIVAKRKEGDCTEHAVLLAALLRAFGTPARVMTGVVLVDDGKQLRAFGHAWTERFDGKTWQLADAALPAVLQRAYVPLTVLGEGPGGSAKIQDSVLLLEKIVISAR